MNKILMLAAVSITFSSFTFADEANSVTETAAIETEQVVESTMNFQSFDTDLDGLISPVEALAKEALTLAFDDLDIDLDGNLSEEEYSKF